MESPWERIGGSSRASRRLLGSRFAAASWWVRVRSAGTSLVGSSRGCGERHRGLPPPLPLNDAPTLREAGAATTSAGGAFHAGLVYTPGRRTRPRPSSSRHASLRSRRDARRCQRPDGGARPASRAPARSEDQRGQRASGWLYVQGAAGVGLASALAAAEAGADLVATAVYPLALARARVSGEACPSRSTALATPPASRPTSPGMSRTSSTSTSAEPVAQVAPVSPSCRGARPSAGLVAALEAHRRAHAAADACSMSSRRRSCSSRSGLAPAHCADRPDPCLAGTPARSAGAPLRHGDRRVPCADPGRLWRHA